MSKIIPNILQRNGTGQEQRTIDALDPENFELHDFTIEDWILFAYSFAEKLNYFSTENHEVVSGDWQGFFKMANMHLEEGWLFIFDINTLYEFENITKDFAQFYNFDNDTVCLEMKKKNWLFQWLVKIFTQRKDWKYDLIEEIVTENSFPINKIKKELAEKWFKILEMIDYHYWQVTAVSERVYFICKKK